MPRISGAPSAYQLNQVVTSPRGDGLVEYGEYTTLHDALAAAQKGMKGARFVIIQKRVIWEGEVPSDGER
jgi:hypothetical protein